MTFAVNRHRSVFVAADFQKDQSRGYAFKNDGNSDLIAEYVPEAKQFYVIQAR